MNTKIKLRSTSTSINNVVIEAFANHPRIEKCQDNEKKILKCTLKYFILIKQIYSVKRTDVLLSTLTIFPLRRFYVCRPRRGEVTGERRRLHNEELNDLYSSPNIVRVIIWRRMRWAGYVARMGEERGPYRVWGGETGGKVTTGET